MRYFADIKSSMIVFLVTLPFCLGIALASGAPLESGILAGIIAGLVVGFLGGSEISVSGPAAGLTAIVAAAIIELGSFQAFCLSVMLAGLFQILIASFKGGKYGDFFPNSVIKGMLAAIGIILILKQLPHLIGYDVNYLGDENFQQVDGENTFSEIIRSLSAVHFGAIIISCMVLGLTYVWKLEKLQKITFFKWVPGDLFAILLAVFINQIVFKNTSLYLNTSHLVNISIAEGIIGLISLPTWQSLTLLSQFSFYKVAFTIAIVASIETLLTLDAADKIDPQKRNSNKNREIFAQGIGNTLCGFLGALPITAVIVRTSTNVTAGAVSRASAIMHGAWLILCVGLIPQYLNLIPLAALASILLVVGFKLTKPAIYKSMLKKGKRQFVPFMVTVIAIVFSDLLIGVLIGMLVACYFIIQENFHSSMFHITKDNFHLLRFNKDVSFLHKAQLLEILNQIPKDSHLKIDGSRSITIDSDIIDTLEDFIETAAVLKNIQVSLQKSPLALSPMFKGVSL